MNDSGPPGESVASLIQRLGPPPADLWEAWAEEVEGWNLQATDANDPIWQVVHVQHDGSLVYAGPPRVRDAGVVASDTSPATNLPSSHQEDTPPIQEIRRHWVRSWSVAGGLGLVALLVGTGLLWFRSTSDPSQGKSSVASRAPLLPNRISGDKEPPRWQPSKVLGPLELTDESTRPDEGVEGSFDLNSLFPEVESERMGSEAEVRQTGEDVNNKLLDMGLTEPLSDDMGQVRDATSSSMDDAIDLMADDTETELPSDAISQETRTGTPATGFMRLPDLVIDSDPVLVPGLTGSSRGLTLRFPSAVPLELVAAASASSDAGWLIRHRTQEAVIADLRPVEGRADAIEFRWRPEAGRVATASKLADGQIVGENVSIDLRPTLVADPITMVMESRDVQFKWDLGSPPPALASRIRLDVELPDSLELGWIEPIDEQSPRRTRAVGVITLTDNEEVAVALRIDVRATKSISMRIRTGARLKAGMPWQWIDRQGVRQSQSEVTGRLTWTRSRQREMEMLLDQAERMGSRRDVLNLQQQLSTLESAVAMGTAVAKQLAELDRLLNEIADSVQLGLQLYVQWPDREQYLFRSYSDSSGDSSASSPVPAESGWLPRARRAGFLATSP
ncbi:MAG: hypothetical protein AAF670_06615 [Planctomycetota bacterium]